MPAAVIAPLRSPFNRLPLVAAELSPRFRIYVSNFCATLRNVHITSVEYIAPDMLVPPCASPLTENIAAPIRTASFMNTRFITNKNNWLTSIFIYDPITSVCLLTKVPATAGNAIYIMQVTIYRSIISTMYFIKFTSIMIEQINKIIRLLIAVIARSGLNKYFIIVLTAFPRSPPPTFRPRFITMSHIDSVALKNRSVMSFANVIIKNDTTKRMTTDEMLSFASCGANAI